MIHGLLVYALVKKDHPNDQVTLGNTGSTRGRASHLHHLAGIVKSRIRHRKKIIQGLLIELFYLLAIQVFCIFRRGGALHSQAGNQCNAKIEFSAHPERLIMKVTIRLTTHYLKVKDRESFKPLIRMRMIVHSPAAHLKIEEFDIHLSGYAYKINNALLSLHSSLNCKRNSEN